MGRELVVSTVASRHWVSFCECAQCRWMSLCFTAHLMWISSKHERKEKNTTKKTDNNKSCFHFWSLSQRPPSPASPSKLSRLRFLKEWPLIRFPRVLSEPHRTKFFLVHIFLSSFKFLMSMDGYFTFVHLCATHVCLVPVEAKRGPQISWHWGYKWLLDSVWVQGIEPCSPGGAASALTTKPSFQPPTNA